MMVPADFTRIDKSVLDISVAAFDDELQRFMEFDWTIEAFSQSAMRISLNFKYPEMIGRSVIGKDILKVRVLSPGLFLSQSTQTPVLDETVAEHNLKRQLDKGKAEEIAAMQEQAQSIQSGSSALMGGSFAINLLLASSLSLLWGLINSLQLVAHFPLLNVDIPVNAQIYFEVMLEVATFDLVPTEGVQAII